MKLTFDWDSTERNDDATDDRLGSRKLDHEFWVSKTDNPADFEELKPEQVVGSMLN